MQVFILQYFIRIVKNLKKRENTENLCLIIRGSQDHALQGPRKIRQNHLADFFVLVETAHEFERLLVEEAPVVYVADVSGIRYDNQ